VAVSSLTLVAWMGLSQRVEAQGYPFSQRTTITQMLAFTEITLSYGRPVARGRVLFGDSGVVKWGTVWHPGADSATRITFTHDVELDGHPLAAGEYSLWLIPRDGAPWTLIVHRAVHVFHTPYPGERGEVLRIDLPPQRGAHMESMAIYFPAVLRDRAEMRIHWGETFVAVPIRAPYAPE
jgi:Protein of unknown function (DUF2911)